METTDEAVRIFGYKVIFCNFKLHMPAYTYNLQIETEKSRDKTFRVSNMELGNQ